MKKTYMFPETVVVDIDFSQALLAGSPEAPLDPSSVVDPDKIESRDIDLFLLGE